MRYLVKYFSKHLVKKKTHRPKEMESTACIQHQKQGEVLIFILLGGFPVIWDGHKHVSNMMLGQRPPPAWHSSCQHPQPPVHFRFIFMPPQLSA